MEASQPFVYNDELTIRNYAASQPSMILQASTFGTTSTDYRIDEVASLYIVNFKTQPKPESHMVDVLWNGFLVGSFGFETSP